MSDEARDNGPAGEEGSEETASHPASESSAGAPQEDKSTSEAGAQAPEAAVGETTSREQSAPSEPATEEDSEAAAKAKAAAEAKAKAEAAAKAKAAREAAEAAKDPWERDPVPPDWVAAEDDDLVVSVRTRHPASIDAARTLAGDLTLEVQREDIREVCSTLKAEEGYRLPVDICGAHYPDREEGQFEVVYHLYNFETNRRIRLKVKTDEHLEVPSVTSVWAGANWPEREVYDMFGVRFSGHPDMTRILLWEGFNGYPLRKDFPVEGIDTGSAIYPEYYEDEAGPVAGTGTGWKTPEPPEPPEPEPRAGARGSRRGRRCR